MKRVVVTGIGIVSPLGCGSELIWKYLVQNKCGISPLEGYEQFGVRVAGIVSREENSDSYSDEKVFGRVVDREMANFTKYALYASDIALSHACVNQKDVDPNRAGVAVACGIGTIADIVATSKVLDISYKKVSPYFVPKILSNMAAGQTSIRHNLKGPVLAPATACAAGAHAIGDAFNLIRLGYADLMLAGGTEASIDKLSIAGFARMKALSSSDEPFNASKPFDCNRDGFVIAEGAALLVLEELSSALRRNAPIIAEVRGYGLSGDAHHSTTPPENGNGAARAMNSALWCAGISKEDITYLNAHATSTPVGDSVEVMAINSIFGDSCSNLLVSSTKGATGHMLGAAGAIEAAFSCFSLRDQILPATLGTINPSSDAKFNHIVGKSVSVVGHRYALTNSFGFGGTNASLIFGKYNG